MATLAHYSRLQDLKAVHSKVTARAHELEDLRAASSSTTADPVRYAVAEARHKDALEDLAHAVDRFFELELEEEKRLFKERERAKAKAEKAGAQELPLETQSEPEPDEREDSEPLPPLSAVPARTRK